MAGRYDVLLLDLNGTFMFGQDRFGALEQYGATYREQGGSNLGDADVDRAVTQLYDEMISIGRRPERYDSFPSVEACLRQLSSTSGWGAADLAIVEQVVAHHELGRIPDEYATLVKELASSHRLGLVSNLWSRKDPWVSELARVGLSDVFEWLVFSSDGSSIKPSPSIFEPILDGLSVAKGRILMIGDSLTRDVGGARAVGIRSLWLNSQGDRTSNMPEPDHWIHDLLEVRSSGVLA